mmetsp:Transcript_125330/g.187201  ORF Transcript_125330/g.187201 Transcript_125330/m.187201 type:complete len:105 (+) Transcript_125330:945-1259(+)
MREWVVAQVFRPAMDFSVGFESPTTTVRRRVKVATRDPVAVPPVPVPVLDPNKYRYRVALCMEAGAPYSHHSTACPPHLFGLIKNPWTPHWHRSAAKSSSEYDE